MLRTYLQIVTVFISDIRQRIRAILEKKGELEGGLNF